MSRAVESLILVLALSCAPGEPGERPAPDPSAQADECAAETPRVVVLNTRGYNHSAPSSQTLEGRFPSAGSGPAPPGAGARAGCLTPERSGP